MMGTIYFDNNATTRLDDEVLELMLPFLKEDYANPASQHTLGLQAAATVAESRSLILELIGGTNGKLIFTSGATEALNIALKGIAFAASDGKNKIITVNTEHKAVLDTCAYLEQVGFEVVYLNVNAQGILSLSELESVIDENTLAVCVMMANNETGTLQPLPAISRLCKANDVLLICDATQAVGKKHVDVSEMSIDILVFSAHKFHGPKGVGALFVRNGVALAETVHGGRHESGLRSGTLNVPGIVGIAAALKKTVNNMEHDRVYIAGLRDTLENELLEIPGTKLNGHPLLRLSNVTNISFPDLDANVLMQALPELAVSNGSACTAAVFEPSHVLLAMGLDQSDAFAAVRFSLSKYNNADEIKRTVGLIRDYLQLPALP